VFLPDSSKNTACNNFFEQLFHQTTFDGIFDNVTLTKNRNNECRIKIADTLFLALSWDARGDLFVGGPVGLWCLVSRVRADYSTTVCMAREGVDACYLLAKCTTEHDVR
jgi:hypothetical protein